MPMICQIPKEDTYDLPEGRYNAVLSSARTLLKATNRPIQQVRLLFAVTIPSIVNKNPMAGRTFNFELGRRSELRGFLENWLCAEWFVNNTTVDFEQLVGRSAQLTLVHHHNNGYNRPFVNIEAIQPAGSLRLTENVEPQTIEMPADESDWRMVA